MSEEAAKPAKKSKTGLTIQFELENETPGTFRYRELSDSPVIGKLYVRKLAAKKLGNPPGLTVKLVALDE